MEQKVIGNCLLIHGDSTEIIKEIPDKSITLVHTDPPYDIHVSPDAVGDGMLRQKLGNYGMYEKLNDANIFSGYDIDFMFKEFKRICKAVNYQIWCNKKQFAQYIRLATDNKWYFQDICLYRNNALPNVNGKYQDKDYCVHLWKGRKLSGAYVDKRTDYHWSIGGKKKWAHPALKPVEPIYHLLNVGSDEGDTVLDPYMGSGTTGVACIQTNRNFIGIEMNKEFYDMAVERLTKELENKNGK